MLARILSFGLFGLEAYPIEIQVDISKGLPMINLVGLANPSIQESKVRVKSAIKNSGFLWPSGKITICLAPSDVKKSGTGFDLAIALGILAASGQISSECLNNFCFLGELSLNGEVRPVNGVLPIALCLASYGVHNLVLSHKNAQEAAAVKDISVFAVDSLKQAVQLLSDHSGFKPVEFDVEEVLKYKQAYTLDFADIKGQFAAKRAIEVAVAGGHNLLFIGPPGSGKTMLAQRIPTILPQLTLQEALQITIIHSLCGLLKEKDGIITTHPFRMPHHTISYAGLIGGGANPRPGEISLAHNGVLFLDELAEFRRDCLEALRQPLEDGCIRIGRLGASVSFPARFILVCAMNPCPCGNFSNPHKPCRCSSTKIANYLGKISGPLLDRIDIHVHLPPVSFTQLVDTSKSESSSQIRERINNARKIQQQRFSGLNLTCNAEMTNTLVKKYCNITDQAKELLKTAMEELSLSARAYDKILKVSRTIADLAQNPSIEPEHIAEAIQYRSLDRLLLG
ncbi:MAG: YifB family Mg chelatase-like AAA ATPase [Candidatus Omnitrophica bacterium]|nr:YifB family Mg chelatase-like AAA ATPase [Candidatus Omnitrophota bacterium]